MHVHFRVSGYYDWEYADKHPGVQVTEADVRALRAKQDHAGKWLIRVEKLADTHHDTNIPEQAICQYIVGQALHAGREHTREEAACHFLQQSYRHHGKRAHVRAVNVHDHGANPDLMKAVADAHVAEMARAGASPEALDGARRICAEAAERYLTESDVPGAITAQFGPRTKKEQP